MKLLINFLGIFLVIFSKFVILNASAPQTQPPVTKALNYKIFKETDGGFTVKLTLTGTDYASTKRCYIKKSTANDASYEDITGCPAGVISDGTKCLRTCTGDDNKIDFDKFSPRTKYVLITTGESSVSDVAQATSTPAVFGLELPLLANPQVAIANAADKKLKFSTTTCSAVTCRVFYKDAEYGPAAGTAGTCTTATENQVEFDLMIPFYEMKCGNYPSFFYKLQNEYTLKNIDVYVPQYYVAHKSSDKTKFSLKFTNKFSYEICRFGIKDVKTTISADSSNEYKSNCGGTDKDCYAPCNDVELILTDTESVFDVLIQTRQHSLKKSNNDYEGYKQQKFVVADTTAGIEGLLPTIAHDSAIFNIQLFHPTGVTPQFESCNVKIYAADKPKPDEPGGANCGRTTGPGASCGNICETDWRITSLVGGKPYILVIKAPANEIYGVPANFKEHIFFRTGKTFPEVTPTVEDTKASITALTEKKTFTKDDVTCAYYISPRDKNVYVCAKCEGSYPCRGFCGEPKKLYGLTPGTDYDLKVVAHKDYGIKKYQFKTQLSTLTLTTDFIEKGFKIIGSLSTEDPTAVCRFNVLVRNGGNYDVFHTCPRAEPAPTPAAPPADNPGAAVSSNDPPAAQPNNPPTDPSAAQTSQSRISRSRVARAGEEQPSTPGETVGDEQPSNSEETAVVAPTTTEPSSCTDLPLCSEILFTSNYDRSKEYKVIVTAVGRSNEASIDIPANVLPITEDVTKVITISMTRDGNKLKIISTMPLAATEKHCGWELRDSSKTDKPLVKSCNGANDNGCESFPMCKEFEILNVEDSNDYELTVYVSDDSSIIGVNTIKKGETYDTMQSTMIAGGATVGVVVIIVIIIIVIMKKKN